MNDTLKFKLVEDKILTIRSQSVILDSDVAVLYGVETRRINEAVKNNPDKFPAGYVFELSEDEKKEVVENFDNLEEKKEVVENFHNIKKMKFSPVLPKAFTEKGLYMLATILKSEKATQTTLAIVETFTKIRELARTVALISENPENEKQKSLMQKSGEIIADLLDDDMKVTDTETSIEINFAVMKFKHTVKKKK
jgi:hypothetical protein